MPLIALLGRSLAEFGGASLAALVPVMCEVRLMRCDRLKWQRLGLRGSCSGPYRFAWPC